MRKSHLVSTLLLASLFAVTSCVADVDDDLVDEQGATAEVDAETRAISPVLAAYDQKSCSINGLIQYYCTTGSISAHSSQHWVRVAYSAYAGCEGTWRLYDSGNGALVGSGSTGSDGVSDVYVYGLYGTYHARFDRKGYLCGGDGFVANFN